MDQPTDDRPAPPASTAPAPRIRPVRWKPVPRKPRRDGWTPERQRAFIAALAELGCIEHAARSVGISVKSCYQLRRAPKAEGFAAAWDAALREADARRIAEWARSEAADGSGQPAG